MKKLLLFLALGLLALVAVVVAIGYALPQDHTASREATFAVPPSTVFDTVADVARYPEWRRDLAKVELLGNEPLRWREHSGGDALTFEATESRRAERFEVRIADASLPFGGTWTYELMPEPAGTRLRITERGEVYNPVFRFLSRFVIGHTATIDTYLADLTRRLAR
jgi:uncharacterized protein YndB with AHSA1/START domain